MAIRWRAQGKVCVGPESAAFGFHWRAQRKVCVGLGSAALTRVTVLIKYNRVIVRIKVKVTVVIVAVLEKL